MVRPGAYLALLRGVNIGGHRQVAMADLCALLVELGFLDVRSRLQSGNLVFRAAAGSAARLERTLEREVATRLRLRTDVFVRSAGQWEGILARNPFPREAERDPGHLIVMFLKHAPGSGAVRALQSAITGREVARIRGREAYIVYPDGFGRSRLTTALIERRLGTRCTGRNWNTVRKLAVLAGV